MDLFLVRALQGLNSFIYLISHSCVVILYADWFSSLVKSESTLVNRELGKSF